MFNPEKFLRYFNDIPQVPIEKIEQISNFKKIPSHTKVDNLGKIPSNIYLLLSGVMRCYIISESGKEFNKSFFFKNNFAGSLTALIDNAPSTLVFETLSDCDVYEIDYHALKKLCITDLAISNLYSNLMEKIFKHYEKRQLDLISLNASQRYLKLKETMPKIDDLVPQYHIASYLRITPVQLSRIRKKLKSGFTLN